MSASYCKFNTLILKVRVLRLPFKFHIVHSCFGFAVQVLHSTLGSLSKGVFERRTATGNETFSLFTRLGATTFVKLCVFTLIETIYLKIRAHPLRKNEKRPLPVAVRGSKTPLLKLPIAVLDALCKFDCETFNKHK